MNSPLMIYLASDLLINRDARGCVTSVNYYSPDRELIKEVFYTGEAISKIKSLSAVKIFLVQKGTKMVYCSKICI